MKNNFIKSIKYAMLVVLLSTANFAFALSNNAGDANIPAIKTIAVKFILAMLGVAFFSILIFTGLSLYNRFFVAREAKDFNLRRDSLKTPQDEDEAVLMFITKNRLQ